MSLVGPTEEDARAGRARGEGNLAPATTSRTYKQIIVENVFTFINLCLFGLGVTLAILGRVEAARARRSRSKGQTSGCSAS